MVKSAQQISVASMSDNSPLDTQDDDSDRFPSRSVPGSDLPPDDARKEGHPRGGGNATGARRPACANERDRSNEQIEMEKERTRWWWWLLLLPSPSLSKRLKASLNSAIWSSVSWSAIGDAGAREREREEGEGSRGGGGLDRVGDLQCG